MSRSIGQINISVNGGLFKIPLKVYSFTRDESSPLSNGCVYCGSNIQKPNYCPKCEKFLKGSSEQNELVKLYKISDDIKIKIDISVIEELKKRNQKCEFLKVFEGKDREVGILTDKVYWLSPAKSFEELYFVLLETLKTSGYKALINYFLRSRTELGIIEVFQDTLILRKLRYPELCNAKPEFKVQQARTELVEQMKQLMTGIKANTEAITIESCEDEYAKGLLKIVQENPQGITQVCAEGTNKPKDELANALALAIASVNKKGDESKDDE